ncbi:MAG: 2-phosphosulfolactate phosphatase [Bacteroidales bacterium]|nr:2-phosphosulfolactate phosphatase [Bacteroidales bacterium]
MADDKKKVEVVFSPALYSYFENPGANVVVVDILRATSAICTAFMNGVSRVIPVPSQEEARIFKQKGYLVAAERDGRVLDFADFGNSPFNFTRDRIEGKQVAYSTTNGTKAVHMAQKSKNVLIASFLNLSAVANFLIDQHDDVLILCAGWKGKFSLEDTLFSGALVEKILASKKFNTICDSATASLDLWRMANPDLMAYIEKVAQRNRLRKLGLDDVLEYCHTPDLTTRVPAFRNGVIECCHQTAPVKD